jgi:fermentation-respiration switch protein FrsA (DUF1100 family)
MSDWAIFGIIIGSAIILSIAAYIFIGLFFYGMSVNRKALVGNVVARHLNKHIKEYKIDRSWWDNQNLEELKLQNGKESLTGYLIRTKQESKKLAIVVHGYYVSHKDVSAQAEIFLRKGFNVFAPDLRAHGKSSGKTIGMGAYDKEDVVLWINRMIEIFGEEIQIVLFGISMGGATVCLVSGEDLPKNVKCVVSDCAYDSLEGQFRFVLKEKINLPEFPILKIASGFIKLIGKYKVQDVQPRAAVEKSKLPILFIHGTVDEFVPSYMVKKLYNASNKRKCEIYLVEDAGHAKSFATNPKEYEKIMINFVDKHIK